MRGVWRNRGLIAVSVLLVAAVSAVPARANVVVRGASSSLPSAVSGDFNGDGRSDIALVGASGSNGVSVALRNTMSGFTVTHAQAPAFAAWASLPGVKIVTGNFDSNQTDDIVLTGVEGWTHLPMARSNGNGTFAVSNALTGMFPGWAGQPDVQVVSGDFNNDGKTDIALTGGDGWSTIPVAFSAGNGTFNVTNRMATEFAEEAWADDVRVFSGDFDADGRTDMALVPGGDALLTNDSIALALSNGDGTFRQVTTSLPDFVFQTDRRAVTAGDFNGDNRTDLAVVLGNMILVAYSNGNGTFSLYRAGASSDFYMRAGRPGAKIVGADYDCDGRTDLTVVSEPNNTWTTMPVAMPRGEEEFFVFDDFMPNFPGWSGVAGAQLIVGDYDADGCEDLALTGVAGWNAVPIALSNGDGSFHEQNVTSPTFAGWAAGASPVTLPPAPTATTGTLSILDTQAWSGIMSSIAVGTDGLGIISYRVTGPGPGLLNLRVAHCVDSACTAITTTDVDTVGDVGKYTSIKIGSDGLALITYVAERNASNASIEDLKVAHCNDVACTSATVTTLDSVSRVNDVSPLAIGGDGLGLIAYQDTASGTGTKIKVAHCLNVACTSATLSTVDTVRPDNGASGGYSRVGIATGNHGLGLVSYYDGGANQMLKVAACTNADCSTKVITIVDRAADPAIGLFGGESAVAFGQDGLALITYTVLKGGSAGKDLKVAHCSNVYCTASTRITADTGGSVGSDSAIAIGGDGLGVISYRDGTNKDLKVAHCVNLACSATTVTTVDAFDDVGNQSSIAMGADGLPLISYLGPGFIGVALRVVQCGSSDCTAPIIAPF